VPEPIFDFRHDCNDGPIDRARRRAEPASLACHTMRVKERKGDVVILHEVGPGTADRSYGIHVAKLAGLPKSVTARAEGVLGVLEKGRQSEALHEIQKTPIPYGLIRKNSPAKWAQRKKLQPAETYCAVSPARWGAPSVGENRTCFRVKRGGTALDVVFGAAKKRRSR
jgi:hypothetical protein